VSRQFDFNSERARADLDTRLAPRRRGRKSRAALVAQIEARRSRDAAAAVAAETGDDAARIACELVALEAAARGGLDAAEHADVDARRRALRERLARRRDRGSPAEPLDDDVAAAAEALLALEADAANQNADELEKRREALRERLRTRLAARELAASAEAAREASGDDAACVAAELLALEARAAGALDASGRAAREAKRAALRRRLANRRGKADELRGATDTTGGAGVASASAFADDDIAAAAGAVLASLDGGEASPATLEALRSKVEARLATDDDGGSLVDALLRNEAAAAAATDESAKADVAKRREALRKRLEARVEKQRVALPTPATGGEDTAAVVGELLDVEERAAQVHDAAARNELDAKRSVLRARLEKRLEKRKAEGASDATATVARELLAYDAGGATDDEALAKNELKRAAIRARLEESAAATSVPETRRSTISRDLLLLEARAAEDLSDRDREAVERDRAGLRRRLERRRQRKASLAPGGDESLESSAADHIEATFDEAARAVHKAAQRKEAVAKARAAIEASRQELVESEHAAAGEEARGVDALAERRDAMQRKLQALADGEDAPDVLERLRESEDKAASKLGSDLVQQSDRRKEKLEARLAKKRRAEAERKRRSASETASAKAELEAARSADFLRVRDELRGSGGLTAEDAAAATDRQLRQASEQCVEQAKELNSLRDEIETLRAQLDEAKSGGFVKARSLRDNFPADADRRKHEATRLAEDEASAAERLQAKLEEESRRGRDAMRQRLEQRRRRRETAAKLPPLSA